MALPPRSPSSPHTGIGSSAPLHAGDPSCFPTPMTSDDGEVGEQLGCHVPSAGIDAEQRQVPPEPRGSAAARPSAGQRWLLRGGDGANTP